ncbi:MAG: AraC family transcriptional regulator [Erysipelotrichia bacterium]|nr:AraC family transcriptional regulator [Erysipelotrichia bacterium]
MTIEEMLQNTEWKLVTEKTDCKAEIAGVYCGDLLSWVMGRGKPGQAWITVQSHINVIAVASLREFACVILADDAVWPPEVIQKAEEEGIPLIQSSIPSFETARKLIELGE